ncbi:hypothetical protein SAMN02745157_3578 [Kaistia soli DSM 19436]|uniref:Lipoprotein n=1 Tax=Kaistia soli DSM 19436 TaxID=1122133 RepID=A0A1M5H011_9HYPH|nr:hypothetical protein [Kaistia soli]SHG09274.1 hypothetical protein SAMN02745157_3578 [Kaistia soli DSM 19436]
MRTLILTLFLGAVAVGAAGCAGTSDPYDPAIRAMEPVNACGTFGSDNINQCRGHPQSNN